MYFLLNMGIFHCYVSLPEGTIYEYIPWNHDQLGTSNAFKTHYILFFFCCGWNLHPISDGWKLILLQWLGPIHQCVLKGLTLAFYCRLSVVHGVKGQAFRRDVSRLDLCKWTSPGFPLQDLTLLLTLVNLVIKTLYKLYSVYSSYVPTQFSKDSICATMKDLFFPQTVYCGVYS